MCEQSDGVCDVELVSGLDNSLFSAHSTVLSQRSKIFKGLLVPQAHSVVKYSNLRHRISLNGYSGNDIQLLIDCVYKNKETKHYTAQQLRRLKTIISDLQLIDHDLQEMEDIVANKIKVGFYIGAV